LRKRQHAKTLICLYLVEGVAYSAIQCHKRNQQYRSQVNAIVTHVATVIPLARKRKTVLARRIRKRRRREGGEGEGRERKLDQ
jgi:hypothetical protein